jgi:hypothetical protein
MWKHRRTWLLIAALIGVTLAVYFEPSHCVRGWLWGETFFDGRPTSYWRSVIEAEISETDLVDDGRQPAFWESACKKCGIRIERQRSHVLITHPGSDGVLAELRQDRSPRVRTFAAEIIDYNANKLPRIAENEWDCGMNFAEVTIAWHSAIVRAARAVPDSE